MSDFEDALKVTGKKNRCVSFFNFMVSTLSVLIKVWVINYNVMSGNG